MLQNDFEEMALLMWKVIAVNNEPDAEARVASLLAEARAKRNIEVEAAEAAEIATELVGQARRVASFLEARRVASLLERFDERA